MDIAASELKANLSAYLELAAAGEMITVTEQGRPIVTIGPVISAVDLSAAAAAGWVTPATTSGLRQVTRHQSSRTVQQVLAEDRSE